MTRLNIKLSLREHKIQISFQNQFKKNQCNCKEADSKVVPCKEHRDHNNNREKDQGQVHQIINNKHK